MMPLTLLLVVAVMIGFRHGLGLPKASCSGGFGGRVVLSRRCGAQRPWIIANLIAKALASDFARRDNRR